MIIGQQTRSFAPYRSTDEGAGAKDTLAYRVGHRAPFGRLTLVCDPDRDQRLSDE